jgi:NADPH:quinone reductase-like Zn-dependent oxidoreductase
MSPDRCVKIPPSLSFKEAATMPCVYATVIHCLLKVGGLQKDQTIMIHSACGGVGLAAIQICQNVIGAKVSPMNPKLMPYNFNFCNSTVKGCKCAYSRRYA